MAAGAGAVLFSIILSDVLPHVPFVTVQVKVELVPAAIPVTVVVGDVAFVIVPPPTILHAPVPTNGAVAFITNVLVLHCVMLARPASAVLGKA